MWVALTDGGPGLEEFVRVYFPRAECVPDFFRAAEHRNGLAKALYPDAARAQEAAGAWCHPLKHEGGRCGRFWRRSTCGAAKARRGRRIGGRWVTCGTTCIGWTTRATKPTAG